MTLAGALLPLLLEELDIGLMEAGSMLALQPIGFLVGVGSARRFIDRVGLTYVLAVGVLTAALGFGAFGSVSTWSGGAITMLIAGVGVGLAEVTANAAVITVVGPSSNRVLNFVHVFFGIGSFTTPFLATRAIDAGSSWRAAFFVVAGITALVGLAWALLPHLPSETPPEKNGKASRTRLEVILLAIMLALYVGTEMGVGGWLTKYMVSEQGGSLAAAGTVLSIYWFALAAGRLLLSALPVPATALSEERRLVLLSAAATAGLVLATTAATFVVSAVGFAIAGLGFSGIFPGVVALGGRYQPHAVAAATSVIITGAGLGNVIIPWGMSATADYAGLTAGMYVYAIMSAAMLGLAFAVHRRAANPADLDAASRGSNRSVPN